MNITYRYGLSFRLVEPDDAEFIVSLRTNSRLSRYINETNSDVDVQKEWINNYKIRENKGQEFYYIFMFHGTKVGLARIYNICDDHFTQGSWIFSQNAPVGSSVLGNIISIENGFELPGMKYLLTDARKGNTTHKYVKAYHPEIIGENDLDIFYKLSKENFNKYKYKYINLCTRLLNEL